MSWAASAYVKTLTTAPDGTKITRSEKMLLFVLADYYNDEQHAAWASIGEVARHALLSVRQAQRLCKALVTCGVLALHTRIDPKHGQLSNLYAFPSLDLTRGDMVSGAGDMVSGAGDTSMSGAGDIAMSPNPLLEPPIREREETQQVVSLCGTNAVGVLPQDPSMVEPDMLPSGKKKRVIPPLAEEDWIWKELQHYRVEFDVDALNDETWWANTGNSFHDFSHKWVPQAFASLARWLQENPGRRPRSVQGWKKRMGYSLNWYYDMFIRRQAYGQAAKSQARY